MDWYKTKGVALVDTMILNMYLPIIIEVGFFVLRTIRR